MASICILTPHADYEERWHKEAEPLRALFGKKLIFRSWADPGDLSRFKLIMPLLAWGYPRLAVRWYGALDAWEASNLPFANPIKTLRWNTDKAYLLDLADEGIAIVSTLEANRLSTDHLAEARAQFACETLVVKPSISGGADGTYRLARGDPIPFDVLERAMLIQPLLPSIAEEGEFSLFCFDGLFSHAILKRPAAGDFRVQEQFGGGEIGVEAPQDALDLAYAVLGVLPEVPLYARIDMLRDEAGAFRLMELEVIEPSLFLHHAPDGGAMLKEAVLRRLG